MPDILEFIRRESELTLDESVKLVDNEKVNKFNT